MTLCSRWLVGLLVIGAGTSVHAAKLEPVLLGKATPVDTPPLKKLELKGAEPLLVVLDTPYEIWSGQGTYVHVAAYLPASALAPAVAATVYVNGRPVGTTDEHGTLVFKHVPRESDEDSGGKGVTVVAKQGTTVYVGGVNFESYVRTASFESAQLFVYTDRGVYNPGQTVFVRLLALRLKGDYTPLAGQTVELQLLTEQGHMLTGARVDTNDFGVASARFPLPEDVTEGRYELVVLSGEARETTKLRIERVVVPAFEIRHTLKRYLARGQKSLPFTVSVNSVVGVAPKSGALQIQLKIHDRQFHSMELPLSGAQSYAVDIPETVVAELWKSFGDGDVLEVSLTVIDAAGRKDTVRRDLTLATHPYAAILEADKDIYAAFETAKVQVKLSDLEGVPVRDKRVRLTVNPGKAPQPTKTQESGIAVFDLTLGREPVEVSAWVDDVEAALGSLQLEVMEQKPMLSKVKAPVVKERRPVTIEVAIAPGYTPVEKVVHGDIVDSSGALVSAFLLPIEARGKAYVARGTFTSPAWGTMLLTLFCAAKTGQGDATMRNTGLLTEGQQITVEPNKALKVTLTGLPKRAAPGETVKVRVDVKDAQGKPAAASLGVSVVDAAALSLLDPLETTPADRFYNPELKVLATTGAKILTWPVVTRNWGDERMDIALPPFGFREGGAPERGVARAQAVGSSGYGSGASAPMGEAAAAVPTMSMKSMNAPKAESKDAADREAPMREGRAKTGTPAVAAGAPSAPRITVRTRFPETTLFLDNLIAQGGKASFDVTLPDSITRQTFTALASDKQGGVGLVRQDLPVVQDLFVRSDLPAVLTLGDEVGVQATVQNLGSEPVRALVGLSSDALTVVSEALQSLTVAPGEAAVVRFRVRATKPGKVSYDVVAKTTEAEDHEQRTLVVLPRGQPQWQRQSSRITRVAPWLVDFVTTADTQVAVELVFPGGGAAVAAYRDFDSLHNLGTESPGTQAVAAYHLMRFLSRHRLLTDAREQALKEVIARDVVGLGAIALPNGGFSYWRNGTPSPYLTGRALEGLAAARSAGFLIPDGLIANAGRFILSAVDAQGLIRVDDIGFWEGAGPERQLALSSELYRIIAEVGSDAVPAELRANFDRLRQMLKQGLTGSVDPLAIANIGLGEVAFHENFAAAAIDEVTVRRLVRRVLDARRRGHWEPSWFNAYGGTLLATAMALELVWSLDPAMAEPVVREASETLLNARVGLNGWHNEAGLGHVYRALAMLPPAVENQKAAVTLLLDGREVLRQVIDPKDPFASALSLSHIELSSQLLPGQHRLEVRYSGTLEPLATLAITQFVDPVAKPLVQRSLERVEMTVGETVAVTLTLPANGCTGLSEVVEPVTPLLVPEPESLAALGQQGIQVSLRGEGGLQFVLPPCDIKSPASRTLRYRSVAQRVGSSSWGPTQMRSLTRADAPMLTGTSTRITVK